MSHRLCVAAANHNIHQLECYLRDEKTKSQINEGVTIARQVSCSQKKRFYATPLMHTLQMCFLTQDEHRVQPTCARLLLENCANANDKAGALTAWKGPDTPESALFHVAGHNRLDLVILLLEYGADPNAVNVHYGINATEAAPLGSDCRKFLRERLSHLLLDELIEFLNSRNVSVLIVTFVIPTL